MDEKLKTAWKNPEVKGVVAIALLTIGLNFAYHLSSSWRTLIGA